MRWIVTAQFAWPETGIAMTEDFPDLHITHVFVRGLGEGRDNLVILREEEREAFWAQIVGA